MLPNFLCIGAQKSGTTSMWHLLNAHPDIYMSATRETRFFFDDILYQEGLAKYEIKYFSNWDGQKMSGEKCPEYLCGPNVAERIFGSLGADTKFIVCLRNPAQRAFSQYRHNLVMLRESRSFEDALAEDAANTKLNKPQLPAYGYISRGMYATQIQAYLNFFAIDRFLFTSFENEIISDQESLSQRVYHFLEVNPFLPKGLPFISGKPPLENMRVQYDQANKVLEISNEVKKRSLSNIFKKQPDSKIRIGEPSTQLIKFAEQFNKYVPTKTQLSAEQAIVINQQYFEKEIVQLQQIINKDCSNWLN